MAPLYGLGDLGAGVHVAIAEFEPNAPSDIAAYQHCYQTSATVRYLPRGRAVTDSGAGQGEAALDIENVIGIAPRATIDVYQAPNADAAAPRDVRAMVSSDDQVISTS